MNPFTLDAAGKPFPLDMRGELDDTAAFRRWAAGPGGAGHCPAGAGPGRGAMCLRGTGSVPAPSSPGPLLALPQTTDRPNTPAAPCAPQRQEVGRRRVPAALWPHHDAAGGRAGGGARAGRRARRQVARAALCTASKEPPGCPGPPTPRRRSPQESRVHELDEATGASLKLSILNPKGRIWTMVAGVCVVEGRLAAVGCIPCLQLPSRVLRLPFVPPCHVRACTPRLPAPAPPRPRRRRRLGHLRRHGGGPGLRARGGWLGGVRG